jgi:hypothetical protein
VRLLEPFETNKSSSFARMLGNVPTIGLSELEARTDEEKFRAFVADLRKRRGSPPR